MSPTRMHARTHAGTHTERRTALIIQCRCRVPNTPESVSCRDERDEHTHTHGKLPLNIICGLPGPGISLRWHPAIWHGIRVCGGLSTLCARSGHGGHVAVIGTSSKSAQVHRLRFCGRSYSFGGAQLIRDRPPTAAATVDHSRSTDSIYQLSDVRRYDPTMPAHAHRRAIVPAIGGNASVHTLNTCLFFEQRRAAV